MSCSLDLLIKIHQSHEKTCLQGFDQDTNGAVQQQKMARAWNFGFRKKRYRTIYVAKTKVLISCLVTVQLICVFVFSKMQKTGFFMRRLRKVNIFHATFASFFSLYIIFDYLTGNRWDSIVSWKQYLPVILLIHADLL